MGVAELNKPAGTACGHLCAQGCAIYQDRPAGCHDWFCLWIRDTGRLLDEAHRPDRLGILFTVTKPDAQGRQTIEAREVTPHASASERAQQAIKHIEQFVPVQVIDFKPPAPAAVALTVCGDPA